LTGPFAKRAVDFLIFSQIDFVDMPAIHFAETAAGGAVVTLKSGGSLAKRAINFVVFTNIDRLRVTTIHPAFTAAGRTLLRPD
jgi:hypothetical protein